MLEFLRSYARDFFASQNGEEGIILEVFRRIGVEKGHAVEVGADNGLYCSNTALLIRDHEWSGTMIETDFNLWEQCRDNWAHRPDVKCVCSHVDKYNVNAYVKENCNLVSFDTDGGDYNIFKGMRNKPEVVIVEIDSSHRPDESKTNADGGVGYRPMVELALEKGYALLCHTGNLILVDQKHIELFPEIKNLHPLEHSEKFFNRSWLAA